MEKLYCYELVFRDAEGKEKKCRTTYNLDAIFDILKRHNATLLSLCKIGI